MKIAQIALLLVVVIDIMGQGLVLPLVTTLILSPTEGILPAAASTAEREFKYGLAIGVFFFAWFIGAAYISKLTDSIGRKNGILICLAGGFVGYGLTIVSIQVDSFALLVIGRAISGFTAGNQPIAQAALIDMSRDDTEKTRYMGLTVMAMATGLVVGALLGGLLSDTALLGGLASLSLPFYAAAFLIIVNTILIVVFFHDVRLERTRLRFNPADALLTVWQACRRPLVLKLSLVFFFSQLAFNSFYVFVADYYTLRFGFGTLQNSIVMIIVGAAVGVASITLVAPLSARFSKKALVCGTLVIMGLSQVAALVNPSPWLAYVLVVPFMVPFAVNYPTMLTLFSASVDDSEQGWVMGVTVALFTLGAGIISLVGGSLMTIDVHLVFAVSMVSCFIALGLVALLWRDTMMARLDPRS